MARPKKNQESVKEEGKAEVVEKVVEKFESKDEGIRKKLIKDFGNIFTNFTEYADKPENIIQTVLPLDIVINKGVRQGSVILLSGKHSAGKSTLSLYMAGKAQQQLKMPVYYLKIEGRLHASLVESIGYINKETFTIIESTSKKILFGEDYLEILTNLLQNVECGFYILDSISMLMPKEEYDKDMDEDVVMKQGKLVAKFLRKASVLVGPSNSIVCFIAQERAKMAHGTGSKTTMVSGGTTMTYQNDLHISCRIGDRYVDSKGRQYGHDMIAKVEKMSWGLGMGAEAAIPLRYGSGIDEIRAVVNMAIQFGLIELAGAWYKFGEEKFQGMDNVMEYFKNNRNKIDELDSSIRKMVFE